MTMLTYPDGKQVSYSYDSCNRLSQVTDWAGRTTAYSYNPNGQLTQTTRPDGSTETRTYDDNGRLIQQKDSTSSGEEISQNDFSYDSVGRITSVSIQPEIPEKNYNMTYTSDNRLASFNGQPVTYDTDGNMINGPLKDQIVNYNYDSRNRLQSVGTTTYTYDAENNRIGLTENGVETQYIINPSNRLSQVLLRTTPDGNITYYIYGLGLIGQEETVGYRTYHYDLRGSTIALTDQSGTITDNYQYGPYGELLNKNGTRTTSFLYDGRDGVITDNNGLYYMRARYYSPEILRFINQDVLIGNINESQSLNRYAYVNGQPISYVDPTGLDAILVNKDVDKTSVVEHMGMFVQDSDENWYYFYWGEIVKYEKVEDTSIFESIDSINAYLFNKVLNTRKDKPYHESVYVKGDFSATHEAALSLKKQYFDAVSNGETGLFTKNKEYNLFTNNCTEVTMGLFYEGALPNGTNVGDYVNYKGYDISPIPDINMNNMQLIFYNSACNIGGFNSAMQMQRNKYEGKSTLMQWWYSPLRYDISTIN